MDPVLDPPEPVSVDLPKREKRLRAEERLHAIEARLDALHSALTDVQILQQRVLDELSNLRTNSGVQIEAVGKLEKEVRRGRWWRRVGLLIRLLIWGAIIGALVYFFVNWGDLLQLLV